MQYLRRNTIEVHRSRAIQFCAAERGIFGVASRFLHQWMYILISCCRSTIKLGCNFVFIFRRFDFRPDLFEPETHLMNSVNNVDMFAV
jgi:hypothetical protein